MMQRSWTVNELVRAYGPIDHIDKLPLSFRYVFKNGLIVIMRLAAKGTRT